MNSDYGSANPYMMYGEHSIQDNEENIDFENLINEAA